ncbi:integrase, partial [Escherichia coli]|nr:integrase [Escherichia coli]
LAPVLLSGFTSQRAGVFSFQQPMPPGIKPPQHCASPDNSGLVWILLLNSSSLHP